MAIAAQQAGASRPGRRPENIDRVIFFLLIPVGFAFLFSLTGIRELTREEARNDEFGLVGMCQGDRLMESAMVCIDCMEEMHEILSEETRQTWDRFREENFPGVPSDFEPFPANPIQKVKG